MPIRFISENELHNWFLYESNLCNTPYVKKYLGKLLQEWVKNLTNPLASSLVLGLFENDLTDINNNLMEWEKVITEDNLIKLLAEVSKSNKVGNADKIAGELKSLSGEMLIYKELEKEKFKKIEKIGPVGDWLCNDNLIVSVKTKLSLDFNYQVIEDTIRGLLCIEGNSILRNYNRIHISDAKEIGYRFRDKVILFLNTHLISLLNHYSKIIPEYYYEDKKQVGDLELNVDIYEDNYECDNAKTIEFLLRENRVGEPKEKHEIKIAFKNATNNGSIFNVRYGTNVWDEGQSFIPALVKIDILRHIGSFDNSYKDAIKQGKHFIGWINISVHPQFCKSIIKDIDGIKNHLSTIIGEKDYKIRITFSGAFELKPPITLEFPCPCYGDSIP
ncbi:MAG: hypothetical protein V1871_05050 [Planctomycetota bacterium]